MQVKLTKVILIVIERVIGGSNDVVIGIQLVQKRPVYAGHVPLLDDVVGVVQRRGRGGGRRRVVEDGDRRRLQLVGEGGSEELNLVRRERVVVVIGREMEEKGSVGEVEVGTVAT